MSGINFVANNLPSGVVAANIEPNSGMSANGMNSGTAEVMEELIEMLSKALAQLQQGGASGGSTGGAPSGVGATGGAGGAGGATGATGTGGAGGAAAMTPQSASGALAGYMGTNGNDSLDMNDLYKLSQGQAVGGNGQSPSPQVQQAAQYMLANPSVYNKIETNDVAGADGKSGIGNFEKAAQGLV